MKKIVIKISSNLLNPDNEYDIIEKIAVEISLLKSKGFQVIVVTSGAVMYGIKSLGLDKKPVLLPLLQSCAAIGQVSLMSRYMTTFKKNKLLPAQVLVSTDDFKIRNRYLNLRNTLEALLEAEAIPIFNENDSINTEELKFGDNDHLSALLTIMVDFNILIILTDVNGVYDKDPNKYDDAKLINKIEELDDEHLKLGTGSVSQFSSGGMRKKLESSMKCVQAGIDVFIGNGYEVSLLNIIKSHENGTYIKGKNVKINARKKWLGLAPTSNYSVIIDKGAFKALKSNSSLLASGIIDVIGKFDRGALINVFHSDKKIAQGLTNYSSNDISLIKGKKSAEFNRYLKDFDYNEVIHKNNLLLL